MANNVTDLGKVGMTLKGAYNSATTYERLDVVTYEGSSYVSLVDSNINFNPSTSTGKWQLMAQKGNKGNTGDDGVSPIITVTKVNGVATITFTDKEGTKTIQLSDGEMTRDMVINALNSDVTDLPLSANQGRILKNLIETVDERKMSWFYITPSTTQSELQEMLDTVGTKIVEFEQGEYSFADILHLNANTTLLLNNSTLNFSVTHGFFNFYNTDTPTKYAGNGNIKILNGTIKGGDISLCHANNVLLQNINFVDILNDHVLEIAACQNYVVDNCYFEGVTVQNSSRNYVECIQIDDMTRSNFPWFASGNNTPYDNTPNNIINIKNCTFKPDSEKSESFVIYTCIGGHTYINDNPNKNINIENCYFTGWNYAAIRPYNWENLLVDNCKFINDTCEEFTHNDFTNLNSSIKDIFSCNIKVTNLTLKNSYMYGTLRFYVADNVTSLSKLQITNNIFEENNWRFTVVDDKLQVSVTDKYLYIFYLQKITDYLLFENNNFIKCQKNILRLGSSPSMHTKITNNSFMLKYTASCFHLYTNDDYTIMNNNFSIESVFDNNWKSSLQKQIFRFLDTQSRKLFFKDNIIPYIDGLSRVDLQSNSNSNQDLSDLYGSLLTLATPNSSSGTNYATSNNRKFSDFTDLVLVIGNLDTNITNITLTNVEPGKKLAPRTYYFDVKINASETIAGTFTIVDDTHYTFNLSNYRIKTVRARN